MKLSNYTPCDFDLQIQCEEYYRDEETIIEDGEYRTITSEDPGTGGTTESYRDPVFGVIKDERRVDKEAETARN